MDAIETNQLSKAYGNYVCLKSCDLRVQEGSVFGLLGPNGAGKTTLLRTLLGYLSPSSGSATIAGFDVAKENIKVRQQVAYLPGDARLFRTMRGRQAIELFAGLHPHGDFENSLLVARELDLDITRRVMFMSTGMRQKLALSIVMGCKAPLVFLDEPTANLDPDVRAAVIAGVQRIQDDGRTVILSSHIFSDIDEACDEVAILRNGSIQTQKKSSEFTELHIVRLSEHLELDAQKPDSLLYSRRLSGGNQELHFQGLPRAWMSWLISQDAKIQCVNSAGVSAIYAQCRDDSNGRSTESESEHSERIAT